MDPVYLDNHSTTRVDPRVVEAMLPTFTTVYGNPGSRNHAFGWQAEELTEKAREEVAALIGADSKEIIFTSGMTESDNLAIKGVAAMYREKGSHIVTVETEGRSVLDPIRTLETQGFTVTVLPVDRGGDRRPRSREGRHSTRYHSCLGHDGQP